METTAGPAWIVTSGEPDPATVERLLRSLPEWFGIESAVAEYVETARHRPAYLAWPSVPAPLRLVRLVILVGMIAFAVYKLV